MINDSIIVFGDPVVNITVWRLHHVFTTLWHVRLPEKLVVSNSESQAKKKKVSLDLHSSLRVFLIHWSLLLPRWQTHCVLVLLPVIMDVKSKRSLHVLHQIFFVTNLYSTLFALLSCAEISCFPHMVLERRFHLTTRLVDTVLHSIFVIFMLWSAEWVFSMGTVWLAYGKST